LANSLSSSLSYITFVGWRYSFTRKRNRFTSVISTVSMLGMVLGVASLIVVLSVMNGFTGELRGRILALVPHGYVEFPAEGIEQWEAVAEKLAGAPGILAVSPFVSEKIILSSSRSVQGSVLTGIDPQLEYQVSELAAAMSPGSLDGLDKPGFNVVLGASLARALGVGAGDWVDATIPRLTVTPLGVFPRTKRLKVVGTFEVGAQPDTYQAYVTIGTGQRLLGLGSKVEGLQVKTPDLFAAPAIMQNIASMLPEGSTPYDWSQSQGSLFQAVKMEKIMVSVLLLSVVVVAAFNIISTLVMSVTEKRRDIAVLRTMGVLPGGIMAIFVAHGLALALIGLSLGALIGVVLASNIAAITVFLEQLIGVKLFDPNVYFISELPAQLLWGDVVAVLSASLVLSILATLYPAWRASRIAPAEVLRYE
jgi:lipoprotein-releasing system permease protein